MPEKKTLDSILEELENEIYCMTDLDFHLQIAQAKKEIMELVPKAYKQIPELEGSDGDYAQGYDDCRRDLLKRMEGK